MRVLQINVVNDPSSSTGSIVVDIHKYLLESGHDSLILYGLGNSTYDSRQVKVSNKWEGKVNSIYARISGYPYDGCYLSTYRIINHIKKYKPDIVHIHVINNYFVNHYRLLKFLKNNLISTVITIHAEYVYTGKCGHAFECMKWKFGCGNCPQKHVEPSTWFFDRTKIEWNRKMDLYKDFTKLIFVSVSEWINDRAGQSPILKDKTIFTIHNGIDTENIFNPDLNSNIDILKRNFNISDNTKVLVHVTARYNNVNKGIQYIVQIAERLLHEDIIIMIIGFEGDSETLPSNIIPINYTKNRGELALYYQMADLTILTSKRETFSMICAESLACGTPVVGFKAGAPEQISLKEYSEFVDYGNIDQLINAINNWINRKPAIKSQIRAQAKNYYSRKKMCNSYFDVYMSFAD